MYFTTSNTKNEVGWLFTEQKEVEKKKEKSK